ncbi:hypothetical protein QLQ12_45915 [Actinoplanes sp. NEAU-A12]|uniref:Uncharacterized protein n=1 Tax=Actinoplanes sandaracinus TaxID=3045177 RepID=A0ABT6X1P7_9ACTN|nr:hypothetical protein [Actinoplanes sandaracinus]MDI6105931.1 hypothetical protein [Actinoplanes sandaracinus]
MKALPTQAKPRQRLAAEPRKSHRLQHTMAAIAAALTVLLIPSPAKAASEEASCSANIFGFTCTAGPINAHPLDHYVWYQVLPGVSTCSWWITDVANGNVVAAGNQASGNPKSNYVGGLYGRYTIKASGALCYVYINNFGGDALTE